MTLVAISKPAGICLIIHFMEVCTCTQNTTEMQTGMNDWETKEMYWG